MEWMILPLRRYADFKGRSRRLEFWMYQLLNLIVSVVLISVIFAGFPLGEFMQMAEGQQAAIAPEQMAEAFGGPLFLIGISLMALWGLGTFIPSLAVTVRRLHDRGLSGWWYGGLLIAGFVPIVNLLILPGYLVLLVFLLLPGKAETNRWGPDPKDPGQSGVFA